MKNKKYAAGLFWEILPYTDVLFIAYLLKLYMFPANARALAAVFFLSWIAMFVLASRSLLTFWKGHFCTGMVPDEKIFSTYASIALLCILGQVLSYYYGGGNGNLIILGLLLVMNIAPLFNVKPYVSVLLVAINYFWIFFTLVYYLKWIS